MMNFEDLLEDSAIPNISSMNQPAMQLTEGALSLVKKNKRIRSLLALVSNKTEYTILRWANMNHANLTRAAAITIIHEESGLPFDQILEEIDAKIVAG